MSKLETTKKIASELNIKGEIFDSFGTIKIRLADGEILSLGQLPQMIKASLKYLTK